MADSEAGWEQFRSDLRVSKMTINQEKPPLRFQIPIRPQVPKYRSGSGPPPPQINLRLVHDSNAFIVDKVVLPRGPFKSYNDPRQRRCYYIVGWPDLPAARPVVDASKILDYVSPRTLEDWEYQDALRREEERERAREAEEHAAAESKALVTPATVGPQPGVKRRPGRPPRAMIEARPPPEPQLNSEQEEILQKRKRGPSLSTPRKSRLAQLVAEEEILDELEEADEDADMAIHRQLESESLDEGISNGDLKVRVLEDSRLPQLGSGVPGSSGGESSRASSVAIPAPVHPPSSLARTAAGMAVYGSPTRTMAKKVAKEHNNHSSSSSNRSSQVPMRPVISTTPIPLPPYLSQAMKQRPSMSKPLAKNVTSSKDSKLQTKPGQGTASTPATSQSHRKEGQERSPCANSSLSHENGFTGFTGFTPIGSTFPRPPKRPADESPMSAETPASMKSKKGREKKEPKLFLADPVPPAESTTSFDPALDLIQGEQDYVVKRLEGDYVLDGVHWFKVRWEGNWPEGQNPTWEPKENIADKLVKDYLKRKAKRGALNKNNGTKKTKLKRPNSLTDLAKRYNSVAEAFEGQEELNPTAATMLDHGDSQYDVMDADDGPDELFVVDEESERAARERKKTVDAQIAAQLATMARGAPRHF
ncbi:hypothetical protein J7T55_015477 [Diaporthe amygdali]|uniref:uncharacterized protein n=1 Tax=Phomopsis amygdali TaxID=1214568 RepID=UPI0022FEFC52|nr:uncharacterized protein J7T55_015477 [Diaporthe amygdali]KAJ0120745.1 hypothetical protein J7T55_015477 [Diaporthe amygdali]